MNYEEIKEEFGMKYGMPDGDLLFNHVNDIADYWIQKIKEHDEELWQAIGDKKREVMDRGYDDYDMQEIHTNQGYNKALVDAQALIRGEVK